jgi:hypothetical protein
MKGVGFDQPLYILPFDHRGSFQTKMFGWTGVLTAEQTAQIAAAKQVIYDVLTVFWDPLVGWRAGKSTREAAVTEIARRYREFVDVFEKGRAA